MDIFCYYYIYIYIFFLLIFFTDNCDGISVSTYLYVINFIILLSIIIVVSSTTLKVIVFVVYNDMRQTPTCLYSRFY